MRAILRFGLFGAIVRGCGPCASLRCASILAALPLFVYPGCSANDTHAERQKKTDPVPIRVATAIEKSVPVQIRTFGNGEAVQTVEIRSQVTGELTDVLFNEGDVVHQGQVLFKIDKRPFEVMLKQAEANLSKAKADLQQSKALLEKDTALAQNEASELNRDTELLKKGFISKEEFEQKRTSKASMDAVVTSDEAAIQAAQESVRVAQSAVDDAKLNLGYCTITSPIAGKTGSLLVHKGNLVQANSLQNDPIVIVNQLQPIYVSFTLPERNLPQIGRAMAANSIEVEAVVPESGADPVIGKISFVDNAVDHTTGTIRMKATFSNDKSTLWPGQYLRIVLNLKSKANAVVVASSAIQPGQAGPYVYVIKPDMTAELRNVQAGETVDDITVIKEGLAAGERVASDGQMRLAPGMHVKILDDNGENAESAPQ